MQIDERQTAAGAHSASRRRLPAGAEIQPDGAHFRVWAPNAAGVEVLVHDGAYVLPPEENGYFSGLVRGVRAGALYRYRLNERDSYPDPASRFQPGGPHEPSAVVDPDAFAWTDQEWKGLPLEGQVIYELHIGTFTPEGSIRSAAEKLPLLAELGITVIELMPLFEMPGRFGWGYDGVGLFAPYHIYGTPDDLRAFVNTAHSLGLAVILDVVYNHLGPDGNYLGRYSRTYFSLRHKTDWGEAINFDGEGSGAVRDLFVANAGYWIDEFHMDGLRLDATQNIYDDSPDHILAAVVRRVREAARGRATIIVAENETQDARLMRPREAGGYAIDGLWNDDLHHAAMVCLTGHNDSYYTDYLGSPQEFLSAMKHGFLYQGQFYKWQRKRRGTPVLNLPHWKFVTFIQNHDQVANSATGERLHMLTSPGKYRAMTALWLLAPGTPMLFQGQEFAASSPFFYFADQRPDLAGIIAEGRREFLRQWRTLRSPAVQETFPDWGAESTFERSRIDWAERELHAREYALHRDLLALRRETGLAGRRIDGAVLSAAAFAVRYFGDPAPYLLLVNFGRDLEFRPAPEPLLAPPEASDWHIIFSTEDPRYGGFGVAPVEEPDGWRIPGESATLLAPGGIRIRNGGSGEHAPC